MRKLVIWLILGVALLGFADATYLFAKHFVDVPLPCNLTRGCESVLTSKYATVGPIPVAFFGVIYYLTVLTLGFLYKRGGNENLGTMLSGLTAIGVVVSGFLIYLQLFVIKSICLYCMFSAASSITLFVLSIILAFPFKLRR